MTLDTYVVYFNPSDYPGKFVVRRQTAHGATGEVIADPQALYIGDDYEDAIRALPDGLTNIGRYAQDDPVIYEVWI